MSAEDRGRKNQSERERRQRRRDLGLVTASDRETHSFRSFVWYHQNSQQINARRTQRRKDNLEAARAKERVIEARRNANPSEELRARWRRKDRLKRLRFCKDREAQQRRITAAAEAIAGNVNAELRHEIISRLVEGVYTGRFPITLKAEHRAEIVREHFRQLSQFDTVSLDEVIGEDGFTRGAALGIL